MPKVIGLDLSIACTGVAGDGWTEIIPTKGYIKKKSGSFVQEERNRLTRHHERIALILSTVVDFVRGSDLVVMEGLSFNAYDTDKQSAGLAWMVRHHLYKNDIPYALVPATSLKLYATGHGGASKQDVIAAVESWYPGTAASHPPGQRDNAADAAVLAAMGREWMGMAAGNVQRVRSEALGGCVWPCDFSPRAQAT